MIKEIRKILDTVGTNSFSFPQEDELEKIITILYLIVDKLEENDI